MLRWLYIRRAPTQAFDIDFGPAVVRLYDEWDALGRKAADPEKADVAGARLATGPPRLSPAGACRCRPSPYRSGRCRRSPTSPPGRPT